VTVFFTTEEAEGAERVETVESTTCCVMALLPTRLRS
jgi:hypothetical protein